MRFGGRGVYTTHPLALLAALPIFPLLRVQILCSQYERIAHDTSIPSSRVALLIPHETAITHCTRWSAPNSSHRLCPGGGMEQLRPRYGGLACRPYCAVADCLLRPALPACCSAGHSTLLAGTRCGFASYKVRTAASHDELILKLNLTCGQPAAPSCTSRCWCGRERRHRHRHTGGGSSEHRSVWAARRFVVRWPGLARMLRLAAVPSHSAAGPANTASGCAMLRQCRVEFDSRRCHIIRRSTHAHPFTRAQAPPCAAAPPPQAVRPG